VPWKITSGRYLKRRPERIVEELATIGEDFYEQCFRLHTKTIPLCNVLAFMMKFRLKEIPANVAKYRYWSKRLQLLHKDYVG
jgi:hypothetical protein